VSPAVSPAVSTVAGEALIDLIVDQAGRVEARSGGGPFTVARTIARLGQPVTFLGRLSGDRFGRRLRDDLERDGVRLGVPDLTLDEPTTLALVDVDQAGVASYRFYLAGTSAAALRAGQARLQPDSTALHIGTLGLAMEPIGTAVEQLARTLPADVLLMLDPNCRPAAIADKQAYLDRIARILPRVDVLKTSTEDLSYLGTRLLGDGYQGDGRTRCVLITDGPAPVRAITGDVSVSIDVPPADVVDTVGAGDAFGGAFLAWWTGNGLGREDLCQPDKVREATRAAIEVAVVTCTRRGADPPRAAELPGRWFTCAAPRRG
jgi:fructokinase